MNNLFPQSGRYLTQFGLSLTFAISLVSSVQAEPEKNAPQTGVTPQMSCLAPEVDTDADGECDEVDLDDDNDGIPDNFEVDNGFDELDDSDALADFDFDDVSNLAEFRAGTDPNDPDSRPGSERSASTVASVLPLSRSAEIGNTVTAFATLVNAGTTDLIGCAIAPNEPLDALFFFNSTDPNTNASSGQVNAPIDVAVGEAQSFIFGFTTFAEFSAREIELRFACENSAPVAELSGINTFTLSSSALPTVDVIALVATQSTPGVLSIPDVSAPGAFAVATVNVGAADVISVSAEPLNGVDLPVDVTLCQTDPDTGACINPVVPDADVTAAIFEDETPTFSVFVSASDSIALDPGGARIGVTFRDAGDEVRGSTSVAIEAFAPTAPAPTQVSFDEVQAVFTQNCALSGCHNASSRAAGLSLQAPAFDNIVAVPAGQMPGFSRIEPGNADDSYIIRKLEGGPGILGSRMPLRRQPLPQSTIDLIRSWIDAGAER